MKKDILTNMTKKTGRVLEQISRNNKLLDANRKQYNPTFLEIMDELQKDDKTLATMLMFWYMQRHSANDIEFNSLVNKMEHETKMFLQSQKNSNNYTASCGCGQYEPESC